MQRCFRQPQSLPAGPASSVQPCPACSSAVLDHLSRPETCGAAVTAGLSPPTSPARLVLLHGAAVAVFRELWFSVEGTVCGLCDASDCPRICVAGVGSFLLYSVHEGIRGIPLDPNDKSDALVPVSGTSLAVGIDFHAGDVGAGSRTAGPERSQRGNARGTITGPSSGTALL